MQSIVIAIAVVGEVVAARTLHAASGDGVFGVAPLASQFEALGDHYGSNGLHQALAIFFAVF
jgi:hypothetical protein